MTKQLASEVMAILWQDGKVMGISHTTDTSTDAWTLPRGSADGTLGSEQSCMHMVQRSLGCPVSTLWLMDTYAVQTEGGQTVLDCFICVIPKETVPIAPATVTIKWFTRDELARSAWDAMSDSAIRTIGQYWDSFFMTEHL